MDKKYIISTLVIILLMGVSVYAAPTSRIERTILPEADSTYDLGSNANRWANIYGDTIYGDGSNLTGITVTGGWATSSSDYWLTIQDTADLTEGTNLYYTQARVWDDVWASTTLDIILTNSQTAYGWGDWSGEGFITDLSGFTTADLSENTNLYFTNTRVADYINGSSTMPVGNWNTAFGWGDHSLAGYYAAADYNTDWDALYNATSTFSGDLSISGNSTTTGYMYVGEDLTVNNQTSTSTINIYSEAADFGGSIIKEKEDGSGCTEQWSGSDGLEYFSDVSCP